MDRLLNALKISLLGALIVVQAGCATTAEKDITSDQITGAPAQEDSSHGWGANLQGTGSR